MPAARSEQNSFHLSRDNRPAFELFWCCLPVRNAYLSSMIGAILVSGLAAAASSLFATISNFVIARKLPDVNYEPGAELPEALFMRVAGYRLVAKLFYLQALVFWAIFAVLVLLNVLVT